MSVQPFKRPHWKENLVLCSVQPTSEREGGHYIRTILCCYDEVLCGQVLLNMRLDNRLVAEDLPEVLVLLQASKAKNISISRRKLAKLQEVFEKCENESLRQSFLVSASAIMFTEASN